METWILNGNHLLRNRRYEDNKNDDDDTVSFTMQCKLFVMPCRYLVKVI